MTLKTPVVLSTILKRKKNKIKVLGFFPGVSRPWRSHVGFHPFEEFLLGIF
jgi:hypothetical protein